MPLTPTYFSFDTPLAGPNSDRWAATTPLRWASLALVAAVLTACSSAGKPVQRAPVADRSAVSSGGVTASQAPTSSAVAPAPAQPQGIENAGKPGYYSVRPGDTLIRIGLETGQNWRDLQAWNGLVNPHLIEVGQVLRVVPPVGTATATPIAKSTVAGTELPATTSSSAPVASSASVTPAPVAPIRPKAAEPSDLPKVDLVWPAAGAVIERFDGSRNKGIDIAGKKGDPVVAALDGKVIYVREHNGASNDGLQSYGVMIILQHSNQFITAYAHNAAALVKESQTVKKGQPIAEMGDTATDRVKLHFEVRRQGFPVDPLKLLPAR
jgi:lipoprotein NlpD